MLINNNHDNGESELLLCFDESGNIASPQIRSVAHQKPYKIWHAVVNVWVINDQANILCTRRAPHVSGNPRKWQTYVGGHVKSDSNFPETVTRELVEEIGLKVDKNNLKIVEKGRREDFKHVFQSYAVLFNEDLSKLNFSDGEIDEAKWISFQEYQRLKNDKPDDWCNGMNPDQYKNASTALALQK